MTHTPGPWSYRSQPHDDWGVVRAGRYWICQAKDPRAIDDETLAAHRVAKTDPWEANARLIAAAPDLLASLTALMEIETADIDMDEYGDDESVGAYTDQDDGEIKDMPLTFGHLRRARAAIARATGAAA